MQSIFDKSNPLLKSFRQSEDYFFKNISKRSRNFAGEAVAYATGVPLADLNVFYILEREDSLEIILDRGKRVYLEEDLPFVVIIPESFCTSLNNEVLKTKGYFRKRQSFSMFLDLASTRNSAFDDKMIIQNMNDKLREWMHPLMGAFESTSKNTLLYTKLHESAVLRGINFHHFSLYIDKMKKPVSSITLSICDGIARIDDVGTLPNFQGRGYGTCLVNYVLSEAKKLGATYCFLESSESGCSIYQKLGFNLLFKNNIFTLMNNTTEVSNC